MPALHAALGAIVLLFGRKLYWVFVAIAGFLIGAHLAEIWLADQGNGVRVLAAVGLGIVGALLAMLAQRVAFALGGLCAGGYLALVVAQSAGASPEHEWIWLAVGAAIGAVFALLLMDWAIIVLSSLLGAGAIVAALELAPTVNLLVFAVLAICGIAFQGRQYKPSHPARTAGAG